MLIKCPHGWELPESAATDESIYWDRRRFLRGLAAGGMVSSLPFGQARSAVPGDDPSSHLYPLPRNDTYKLDRPLTNEAIASTNNNFYEFGSHKQIAKAAQKLPIRPWTVVLDGLVEKERALDIDDLLGRMPLEERLYQHRCVEAWSMAVPWSGFAMRALVDLARPLAKARYVVMETFLDRKVASGQKQFWYPWPYKEGLTLAEATNDLAFLVTGVYGKPLPKQYGAPLRLALPWKYGFKSIKSIVRFSFTARRPVSFWQQLNAKEYGFWANVNPEVRHPRWSQATEELLGTGRRVPTLKFNGYGEYVAGLYSGMTGEDLYR